MDTNMRKAAREQLFQRHKSYISEERHSQLRDYIQRKEEEISQNHSSRGEYGKKMHDLDIKLKHELKKKQLAKQQQLQQQQQQQQMLSKQASQTPPSSSSSSTQQIQQNKQRISSPNSRDYHPSTTQPKPSPIESKATNADKEKELTQLLESMKPLVPTIENLIKENDPRRAKTEEAARKLAQKYKLYSKIRSYIIGEQKVSTIYLETLKDYERKLRKYHENLKAYPRKTSDSSIQSRRNARKTEERPKSISNYLISVLNEKSLSNSDRMQLRSITQQHFNYTQQPQKPTPSNSIQQKEDLKLYQTPSQETPKTISEKDTGLSLSSESNQHINSIPSDQQSINKKITEEQRIRESPYISSTINGRQEEQEEQKEKEREESTSISAKMRSKKRKRSAVEETEHVHYHQEDDHAIFPREKSARISDQKNNVFMCRPSFQRWFLKSNSDQDVKELTSDVYRKPVVKRTDSVSSSGTESNLAFNFIDLLKHKFYQWYQQESDQQKQRFQFNPEELHIDFCLSLNRPMDFPSTTESLKSFNNDKNQIENQDSIQTNSDNFYRKLSISLKPPSNSSIYGSSQFLYPLFTYISQQFPIQSPKIPSISSANETSNKSVKNNINLNTTSNETLELNSIRGENFNTTTTKQWIPFGPISCLELDQFLQEQLDESNTTKLDSRSYSVNCIENMISSFKQSHLTMLKLENELSKINWYPKTAVNIDHHLCGDLVLKQRLLKYSLSNHQIICSIDSILPLPELYLNIPHNYPEEPAKADIVIPAATLSLSGDPDLLKMARRIRNLFTKEIRAAYLKSKSLSSQSESDSGSSWTVRSKPKKKRRKYCDWGKVFYLINVFISLTVREIKNYANQ